MGRQKKAGLQHTCILLHSTIHLYLSDPPMVFFLLFWTKHCKTRFPLFDLEKNCGKNETAQIGTISVQTGAKTALKLLAESEEIFLPNGRNDCSFGISAVFFFTPGCFIYIIIVITCYNGITKSIHYIPVPKWRFPKSWGTPAIIIIWVEFSTKYHKINHPATRGYHMVPRRP